MAHAISYGNCRSCGAAIRWVRWPKTGKTMPLDRGPKAQGNIVVDATGNAAFATATDGPLRYVSHFATCPAAGQHRKAR